jgi:hypothetical protein
MNPLKGTNGHLGIPYRAWRSTSALQKARTLVHFSELFTRSALSVHLAQSISHEDGVGNAAGTFADSAKGCDTSVSGAEDGGGDTLNCSNIM